MVKRPSLNLILSNEKQEASVWITWVIRNLGDGVLGHAHLGKGSGRGYPRRLQL